MKKTSNGDSPLRQGARKSFWTLPAFGSTAAADRDVFWKGDRVFRFFPSGGLYRRRGSVRSGPSGAHHRGARASPRPCPLVGVAHQWLLFVSPSVFWKLREISGRLAFVSSNSENISCVTFLKHKNSKKQGTGTVVSR
jgi:hypothetical protein